MASARPKASNPGPRLALDAGMRTFIGNSLRLKPDHGSLPAGLIDGLHGLQRAVTVFSGRERLLSSTDSFAEIEKLPLEGRHRNRHRVGCARSNIALKGRALARIIFDIPRCELVAGEDG